MKCRNVIAIERSNELKIGISVLDLRASAWLPRTHMYEVHSHEFLDRPGAG